MLAVEVAGVLAFEGGLHGADFTQRVTDGLDVLAALEHAGATRRHVGIVGVHVPGAPHDVVEGGQWNEVADERRTVFGALAQADGAHLREGPDRLAEPALGELDAGDEGGGDGTEADGEDAEAAGGRGDGG